MEHIVVNGLTKTYCDGTGVRTVLDNVSFEVHKMERIAVIGASGSGKSTLLNILSTIDDFDDGSLKLNGVEMGGINAKEKSRIRLEKMGFIFQKYCLIQTLSVYDNIILPVLAKGEKIDEVYIHGLIKRMGIEKLVNKYPYEMSGGEQQRTAIARAMAGRPEILFADEATGNLDKNNSETVMDMITECIDSYGMTFVYVTHDMELTKYSNRILKIEDGGIRCE